MTVSGIRPGSRIQPWWQLKCDPLSTRVIIAVSSGAKVGYFCEPDPRQRDESENSTDGAKRFWRRVFQFPRIWRVVVLPSPRGLTVVHLRGEIQDMNGLSPPTDWFDNLVVAYLLDARFGYSDEKNRLCVIWKSSSILLAPVMKNGYRAQNSNKDVAGIIIHT